MVRRATKGNMTTNLRQKKSILAINVGLAANTLLAILKTSVGIFGHSPALLADGINSTSDVAYGIVVSIFMRLSGKPADEEHPYGHDRLESIAAVVVGAFVITTAISIFWAPSVGQDRVGPGALARGDQGQTGEYLPFLHLAFATQRRG